MPADEPQRRPLLQEPDQVSLRRIMSTLVIALALAIALAAWAAWMVGESGASDARSDDEDLRRVQRASLLRESFHHPSVDPERHRQAARLRLESYGWSDRERGRVHIPIDRAIEQIIEEAER